MADWDDGDWDSGYVVRLQDELKVLKAENIILQQQHEADAKVIEQYHSDLCDFFAEIDKARKTLFATLAEREE